MDRRLSVRAYPIHFPALNFWFIRPYYTPPLYDVSPLLSGFCWSIYHLVSLVKPLPALGYLYHLRLILLQSCYCWVAYVGWTMMNIYCCWWFQTSCLPTQEPFSRPCMGLTVRIVGQKHHGLREIPIPHVLSAKNPLISRCRILLVRAMCVRDRVFFF